MMLRSAASLLASLALTLAACDSDPAIPRSVVGTYDARILSGEAIPYHRVDGPGVEFEILSGAITFRPDGEWSAEIVERLTGPGEVRVDTAVSDGTYAASGRRVLIRVRTAPPESPSVTATLRNDTLRWESQGLASVFTRRR